MADGEASLERGEETGSLSCVVLSPFIKKESPKEPLHLTQTL